MTDAIAQEFPKWPNTAFTFVLDQHRSVIMMVTITAYDGKGYMNDIKDNFP